MLLLIPDSVDQLSDLILKFDLTQLPYNSLYKSMINAVSFIKNERECIKILQLL